MVESTEVETSGSEKSGSGGAIAADAVFNQGDVACAQGMIPHHRQAVEMAEVALALNRNAGAAVKDLATRIQCRAS